MTQYLLFLIVLCQVSITSSAQSKTYWKSIDQTELTNRQLQPDIQPSHYQSYLLGQTDLKKVLAQAPQRFSDEASEVEAILYLPMPDGLPSRFRIEVAPVLHPILGQRYPNIQSYVGYGIDDPYAYARFDISPNGFHGQIQSPRTGTIFIDPYSKEQNDYYLSYYKSDYQGSGNSTFQCGLKTKINKEQTSNSSNSRLAGDCQLRKYRLALSCTGEYASFHGGTVPSVVAAMNTAMTRVNGVFERDLGIIMEIVPDNEQLIFLNAGSDPFTNGSGGTMLGQNQMLVDNTIGNNNYDIGHVFSTGGGGIAGAAGNVCVSSGKAEGVTGQPTPVNDPFYIDYVAHEMGHQFGANHTQNNSCNRVGAAAMEPGSASTIMGYAGICPPNVQFNSDAYFHAISIQEISNYTNFGQGSSCPETMMTDNHQPTADAGPDRLIPISTPFTLACIGTDEDGDALTYCWEQMDPEAATMPPVSTSSAGPLFRSYSPVPEPFRHFPRLSDLINNFDSEWEELPGVSRTMNFRCTVRDNHVGNGCTAEDNVVLTVVSSAGPFLVLEPNTTLTWIIGAAQMVTWDVANTNNLPINCTQVDILLSTDGGLTYPTTLATAVPNNGMAQISVPNLPGNQNRVKVLCSDNVFFDISDTDFSIEEPPSPIFTFQAAPQSIELCGIEAAQYSLTVGSLANFDAPVTLSLTGLPTGASATFDTNPVTAFPSTILLTISDLAAAPSALYNLNIVGISDTLQIEKAIDLQIYNGALATAALANPASGTQNVSLNEELNWVAQDNAKSYTIEIATDPLFNTIIETANTNNNSYVPQNLLARHVYYWRVKASSPCGEGDFSDPFAFQTVGTSCLDFTATDVPISIDENTVNFINSQISINEDFIITDVDVQLEVAHTWVGDLIVELQSPDGTSVNLVDQPGVPTSGYGCGEDDLSVTLDDNASLSAEDLESTCNDSGGAAVSGTFQPITPLSVLNGESTRGEWTLRIDDRVEEDGGSLDAWNLHICFQQVVQSGLSFLNNKVLSVIRGNSRFINQAVLEMTGTPSSPEDITFVLKILPANGQVLKGGFPLGIGDFFTQADVNNGNLLYSHDGSMTTSDQFSFDVYDTEGGWLMDESFHLDVLDDDDELAPLVIIVNNIVCHGDSAATITIDVLGGQAPFQFRLEGMDFQNENTFQNMPAGVYTVYVRDANNDEVRIDNITIDEPEPLGLMATVINDQITASVSGGVGVIMYTLNNGTTQTDPVFTNVDNGNYTLYAEDENGCRDSVMVEVSLPVLLIESVDLVEPVCFGLANGSITINVSGGIAPYSYSLDGGPFQPENFFNNLVSANYTITVQDDLGQEFMQMITLPEPIPIVVNPMVDENDIIVITGGGFGTLFYSLDGGTTAQTDSIFTDLPNDTYTITVTDDNGCTGSAQATIDIVGLTETPSFAFEFFPNPSNAIFYLTIQNAENKVMQLELYDALGRQIERRDIGIGQHQLDLSQELAGLYFVHLSDGTSHVVQSLVLIR